MKNQYRVSQAVAIFAILYLGLVDNEWFVAILLATILVSIEWCDKILSNVLGEKNAKKEVN